MFPLLYIAPRGLITILLFFQIQGAYRQFAQPQFDQGILLVIILVSSIIMTIALVQNGITVRGVTLVPEMVPHEEEKIAHEGIASGDSFADEEQSEKEGEEDAAST